MPSPRQLRTLLIGVVIGVVFVLFYTSSLRNSDNKDEQSIQDFYHKTVNGLNKRPPGQAVLNQNKGQGAGHVSVDKDADGDVDEDDAKLAKDMQGRLKAAEDKAKESANKKAPLKPDAPSEVVGKGNSAAGQDKKKKEKTGSNKEAVAESTKEDKKEKKESDEEHAVEVELNSILKKSPVIIFSKTYCPYSKKAKEILLTKYSIEPAPFVVELDKHPLGPQLQAFLGQKTGRKTVPNILVNSVSIGGGDDIVELDDTKKLMPRIVDLGQKKVEMKLSTGDGPKKEKSKRDTGRRH